jgi:hypothetical protein
MPTYRIFDTSVRLYFAFAWSDCTSWKRRRSANDLAATFCGGGDEDDDGDGDCGGPEKSTVVSILKHFHCYRAWWYFQFWFIWSRLNFIFVMVK